MQNFLPTTNTTPGYLAFDYFTPGPSQGFDQVRNDKKVQFSIQPVVTNTGFPNLFLADYQDGDTFSMAIGNFDQPPTDGVFSLQVGSTTSGLANLVYNISASALQTALNAALTTEGKPLCNVLLLAAGSYNITGVTNGAITDGFFAVLSTAGLYPISNAFFTKGDNGSVSTPYRYLFTLRQAPMCYAEPTDVLPDADVTITTIQAGDADHSKQQQISFTVPQVSTGSYSINATANSVTATCGTIGPLASARALGLILAQHPEIRYSTPGQVDNIAVEALPNQRWNVTFIGNLKNDDSNELTVENYDLVGPMGLSGDINYNTYGLVAYSVRQGDTFELTRQIQRTRGTETRTLTSTPVTIFKEMIDAATAVPTPTINYYTASQVDALLIDKMDVDAENATLPDALNNLLPSQGGNAGKVLKTDGSLASWQNDTNSEDGIVYLGSNQVVTNNTTPANTGLTVSLTAGVWLLKIEATVTVASSTPNAKFMMAYSGVTALRERASRGTINQPQYNFYGTSSFFPLSGGAFSFTGISDNAGIEFTILVSVATTGTATLQFAQDTSSADNSTLNSGSWLTYEKQ